MSAYHDETKRLDDIRNRWFAKKLSDSDRDDIMWLIAVAWAGIQQAEIEHLGKR